MFMWPKLSTVCKMKGATHHSQFSLVLYSALEASVAKAVELILNNFLLSFSLAPARLVTSRPITSHTVTSFAPPAVRPIIKMPIPLSKTTSTHLPPESNEAPSKTSVSKAATSTSQRTGKLFFPLFCLYMSTDGQETKPWGFRLEPNRPLLVSWHCRKRFFVSPWRSLMSLQSP